jgi:hypothetical protein
MKNKILLLSLILFSFVIQSKAQNRATVNAINNEISDNLDLRAVASIFGDSRNLEDFERRLNDPEIQISNLDLNNDNQVDYLRVIETVEYRTHVIIIQSVLDRDVYQDVATIDIEKNRYNKIQIQIVGNEYMYGPNYIYEPIYYNTPVIYASFWASNYHPYVSNWYWNYYPSYYYAWNPFPVYRYRNNIQLSLNLYNSYNYVNYRRSSLAITLYNSRRSNWYERQYPNYAFSRRYNNYSNRYDLDQRRRYSNEYSRNRNYSSRQYIPQRRETQRDYTQNRTNTSRQSSTQRIETQRNYSQSNANTSRQSTSPRVESQRNYSQNNANMARQSIPQRSETQRNYSQNKANSSRQSTSPRVESQRNYSQNNANMARQSTPQRTESRNNTSNSKGNNRRI